MYVLVDIRTGRYVAPSGSESSFTRKLDDARTFPTYDAAEAERCKESERVASVRDCPMFSHR